MKNIVFDSWPLIAFFEEEPAAAEVEKLFLKSRTNNSTMIISTVNLGEIWYTVARAHSKSDAEKIIKEIRQIRIHAEVASWKIAEIAAEFKYRGGISYADCFAAALAKIKKAPLVTGDKEFKQLEDEIDIIWV